MFNPAFLSLPNIIFRNAFGAYHKTRDTNRIRAIPHDYIVLPAFSNLQPTTIYGYHHIKTQLVFLWEYESNPTVIYLPTVFCLPFKSHLGIYEFIRVQLIKAKIAKSNKMQSSLDEFWLKMKSLTPLHKNRRHTTNCPYFEGSGIFYLVGINLIDCLADIVNFETCRNDSNDAVKTTLKFDAHKNVEDNAQVVSYGAQQSSIRYTMYISDADVSKTTYVGTSVTALFAPISLQGWIWLVTTITVLGFILRLSCEGQVDSYLWLLIASVEQGTDLKTQLANTSWYLVAFWIYAAFLLRNVYTSSMFSYLTKKPDMKGIPENFHKLVSNVDFKTYLTVIH